MAIPESKNPLAAGIISAAVLAVGTLYVFWRLNATGPVATVKLFNVAVQERDEALLNRVTDRDVDPSATQMTNLVGGYLKQGATYKVVDIEAQTNQVKIQATYSVAGRSAPMFFVLNREGHDWRIDSAASLNLLERALGLR